MISRRDFLQVAAATAALAARPAGRARFAQQRLTQADLLRFEPLGNVTLRPRHRHPRPAPAGLFPRAVDQPRRRRGARAWCRISPAARLLDHLQDPAGIGAGLRADLGGFRRARQELRPASAASTASPPSSRRSAPSAATASLFLDGGDTWQNSYTSLSDQGPGHGRLHGAAQARRHDRPLGVHARRRRASRRSSRSSAFRSSRRTSATPNGTSRPSTPCTMIERGGVKIAVIGQALPYTPIANPRWMIPNWSFGIREDDLQRQRREGAQGRRASWSCCCRTTASTSTASWPRASRASTSSSPAHTHDALPEVVKVGKTLLVASGSHGKFVSRLDLDVRDGEVKGYPLQADPGLLRRDRARCRDGGDDRRRPRAAREDAAAR